MGNDGSRVIKIDNVQEHLNCCEELQAIGKDKNNIDCPIYGNVHYVRYNDMQFFLGQSQSKSNPHPKALHYLIPPGLLVIS